MREPAPIHDPSQLACAILVLALAACGRQPSVVERPGQPDVLQVPSDDEEMNAAIQRARGSIETFIVELPGLRERGEYYSVKVPIQGATGVEHVWLSSPEFKDGVFQGAIGNEPLGGSHKMGDLIRTPATEISDWMAVRDGQVFGAFTVFVVRSRLPPQERKKFDESVGYVFPEAPRPF